VEEQIEAAYQKALPLVKQRSRDAVGHLSELERQVAVSNIKGRLDSLNAALEFELTKDIDSHFVPEQRKFQNIRAQAEAKSLADLALMESMNRRERQEYVAANGYVIDIGRYELLAIEQRDYGCELQGTLYGEEAEVVAVRPLGVFAHNYHLSVETKSTSRPVTLLAVRLGPDSKWYFFELSDDTK
jgi:hypothetical protein